MASRSLPDLSPHALGRLVTGMTTEQVEAVIGPYLRPNLHRGRRFYAWIGDGAMLRAFFNGPNDTLSAAVLDVTEEQRVLDLRGDARHRVKNSTIKRVWNCISCRKSYRRSAVPVFVCPTCRETCEFIPRGIRIPRTTRIKEWDKFWVQYKAERALLDAYSRGELREKVRLEIFGVELKAQRAAKRTGSGPNSSLH